ncbi:MAG TPA: hypothetical protein VM487_18285, partial [Phycisphaerae bacterium]|nr:hypothetical protein [Phycisphaerae bacterium]
MTAPALGAAKARFVAVALGLLVAVTGCTAVAPPHAVRLSLAGAQIPLELVESWLRDADEFHFQTERV